MLWLNFWNRETLLFFVLLLILYFFNDFNFLRFFLQTFIDNGKVTFHFVSQFFDLKSIFISLYGFLKIKSFDWSINDRFIYLFFGLFHLLLFWNAFMWFCYWLIINFRFYLTDLYFLLYLFWWLDYNLLIFVT